MPQERWSEPFFRRRILQSGVLSSHVKLPERRQKLAKMRLKPSQRSPKQARWRLWFCVVTVFLGVMAMLIAPYLDSVRDIARLLGPNHPTKVPQYESRLPVPTPTSYLPDRRAADK